uniref:Putative conserved plasma membrane protein n=1 Tax=Ixodes ricinus TaxID=34613 RepID=A0A131XRX5_IXORI
MKGKWMAYLQFWNLIELIFCITGLCYIACCLAEFVALENLLGHVHHKRMNIFEFSLVLATWQHVCWMVLGFLIFINTLSLLRVFYIIQQSWMFQFISIISRVWKESACLCVCWMVILGSGSFLSQVKLRAGVVHLTTTIFREIASSFGLVSQVTMVYPWNHVGELLEIGTWILGTTVIFAAVKALNIQQKKVFKHRSIDGMNIRLLVMGLKERLSILFGKSIYGQEPSGDCRKLHGEFLLFELEKLMDELVQKADQLFPQCSIDAFTESTLACNPNLAPLNEDGGASSSSLSHPIFEGSDLLKTGNGCRTSSPNSIYFASSSEKSMEHRHVEHRSAFHRRRRVLDLHRTALKVSKRSLAQMSKQSLRQKTTALRGSLSELSSSSSSSLQRARRQNERLAHFRQLRTKSREKVHNGNVRTVWDDRVLAYLKG